MVNPMKYPRVAFMILIPREDRFHIEMIFHYLSYPLNLSESTTTLPHKPKAWHMSEIFLLHWPQNRSYPKTGSEDEHKDQRSRSTLAHGPSPGSRYDIVPVEETLSVGKIPTRMFYASHCPCALSDPCALRASILIEHWFPIVVRTVPVRPLRWNRWGVNVRIRNHLFLRYQHGSTFPYKVQVKGVLVWYLLP